VLINLSKGRLGTDNAAFLGMVLLPHIFLAALSRVEVPEEDRRDVCRYVDELQNYPSESVGLMLAEACKYHLRLTVANQHVRQLTEDVRHALVGNVGNLVAFRVGQDDAQSLSQAFAPSPLTARPVVAAAELLCLCEVAGGWSAWAGVQSADGARLGRLVG
jgi:hypothetical protein